MTDPSERLARALEGRYTVERKLGEGGMATVYLAQDVKHGRNVALKVLKPELAALVGAERFLAEIRTTANLQHPHILPLYDSGEADGVVFYVMPFVEGVSLRERLDREHQLPVDEAVRIAAAVAHALDYAHRHGVIHRDVKPANILLQDGEPLVADFGIALAVQEAGGGRLTETGLSLGTPYYMSPEQATAERDPGPRSDVYSLGCVLYEMLTGEPPFSGRSAQTVLAKILTDPVRRPRELRSTVPPHVDAAVARALEKIPADRFDTAGDFADALGNPSFDVAAPGAARGGVGARGMWNPLSVGMTALAAALLAFTAWDATRTEAPGAVLRYRLALAEAEALDLADPRPRIAISPDGSRILYLGPGPQGLPRLWLLDRDRLGGRPVPGTEGAINPFFSPDGTRIGFSMHPFAGRGQAIAVASPGGGTPRYLIETAVGLDGATWGVDGFVYYDGITGGGTTGVMRVPAEGGPPEMVTTVDTARGETDHVWPHLLPDGTGLIFTILREDRLEEADIGLVDLESGEKSVLVRGVAARFAPPRHLVFVRADGTLAAVPFDLRRKELAGEPVEIDEGLSVRLSGSVDLAVSASGTLVYLKGEQTTEPEEIVWIDRSGTTQPVEPGWVGDFRSLALSPDGRRLAFSVAVGGWTGVQDIHVKDVVTGTTSRLSLAGSVLNHRPAWSSDGEWVVFISDRAGQSDLYRRRADGAAESELLLDGDRPITNVALTADGQWVVYSEGGDLFGRRFDAWDEPIPLVTTGSEEGEPAVSPDGRWLAYTSDETGTREVYVSPFPNTSEARHAVSAGGGFSPRWARSGNELFHKTPDGTLVATPMSPEGTLEPGRRQVVISGMPAYRWRGANRYDVAPGDDRFLVLGNRTFRGGTEIVVVERFDQVLRELTRR